MLWGFLLLYAYSPIFHLFLSSSFHRCPLELWHVCMGTYRREENLPKVNAGSEDFLRSRFCEDGAVGR